MRARTLGLVAGAAACVGLLAGCLAGPPRLADAAPGGPALRPEVFFAGPTRGVGTLRVRGRAAQTVRVESVGRAEPGGFRLDQTVTVGGGRAHRRTWHMRPDGPDGYTATLSDAAGPVTGAVEGGRLALRYVLRRPGVTMEQRLTLRPDGRSALNEATVRVFGVPWARLSEEITRVGP